VRGCEAPRDGTIARTTRGTLHRRRSACFWRPWAVRGDVRITRFAAVAQTAPSTIVPTTSAPDPQELKAMSADLAVVRQKVDQLAAQVAANQEQMAGDFATKLQAAEQDIVDKISAAPPAAPVRKPVPSR
jgi:hypothetical protein